MKFYSAINNDHTHTKKTKIEAFNIFLTGYNTVCMSAGFKFFKIIHTYIYTKYSLEVYICQNI